MLTLTDVTDIKHLSETAITAINPNRCVPDPRARHIWFSSGLCLTSPFVFFQYQTFCTAPLPEHIRSCTAVLIKWVSDEILWSCSKLKSCLLMNNFVCYVPSRLWTLGTASCTDCHRRAGVAGPDHRLLKAADAGVLSLHGGPKRPRQRESFKCKTPHC